jgi:hypothetical protein
MKPTLAWQWTRQYAPLSDLSRGNGANRRSVHAQNAAELLYK